jgi:hypothetical protein
MTDELDVLRKKYQGLNNFHCCETKEMEEIRFQIYILDSKIKDIDKSIGQWTTPGGNYPSTIKSIKKSFFTRLKNWLCR